MSKFIQTMIGLATASLLAAPAMAAPVNWADWTSGTAGPDGMATGAFNTVDGAVDIAYSGEIAFIQTGVGTNYFAPGAPYISAMHQFLGLRSEDHLWSFAY